MGLQDTENRAPDSFSDTASPSDQDAYSFSPHSTGVRFDASSLPQPISGVGYFLGFSAAAVRFKTETTIHFAESKLGRKLDQDESQALAYHIYQLEQTKSYFAATAAALGTWRWYSTWDKMRYPFYQPKLENIDPNKFLFITGPRAQLARQTSRFSLYFLAAGYMGGLVGQVIAQPLAAANTSNDPRLQQFAEELRATAQATLAGSQEHAQQYQDARRELEERMRNRSGRRPSSPTERDRQAPTKSDEDDSSPTHGNEAWNSSASTADSWENFSNDAPRPGPQQQQSRGPAEAWDRQPPPKQSAPSSSSPFDDEASPTGGLLQDEIIKSQQSQSQPQSSWDRLRRGDVPIPIQRPPQPNLRRMKPEQKDDRARSPVDDSDSFVDSDEERKRERERAQKEFDARLQRERQGRDFNSDENKKW